MLEGHGALNRTLEDLSRELSGEARDHARRVSVYAAATAVQLKLPDDMVLAVRVAAELHEAGQFPSELASETAKWFAHPWNGAGAGPPVGKDIPIGARVLSAAHEFDLLTMPPRTNTVVAQQAALEYLELEGGRRFDPAVVTAFKKVQRVIQPLGL